MHKHRNSVLPFLFVIALCLFFTLSFVGDITLKLQKISTRTFVHRLISLSRSAVHKNCNSAYPFFGVIALCLFHMHLLSVFGI